MLESALQAGFISSGIDVKLAGPIPTPAVSFLTATYSGQFGVSIRHVGRRPVRKTLDDHAERR